MSKEFWKATAIRAVRTICQTAVATIGTTALITEVDWAVVVSASALVAYDRKQAEITSDTNRAFYAIKLMDSTGAILKSEERDLTAIREPEQAE